VIALAPQLHDLALVLAQMAPRGAPLRIFMAMWLVAVVCVGLYMLRRLLKRRGAAAQLTTVPRSLSALVLVVVVILFLGLLFFVITRG